MKLLEAKKTQRIQQNENEQLRVPDSAIDVDTPTTPSYPAHPGRRFARHDLHHQAEYGGGHPRPTEEEAVVDDTELDRTESGSTVGSGSGFVAEETNDGKLEVDEGNEGKESQMEESLKPHSEAMDANDWAVRANG